MPEVVRWKGGKRFLFCERRGGMDLTCWRGGLRLPNSWTVRFLSAVFVVTSLGGGWCLAQAASDDSGSIHGVVINSVTREPIDRALVSSPDNRFATMTNSEGRFEFSLPQGESGGDGSSDSSTPYRSASRPGSNRPFALMARKPGFLTDPNQQGNNLRSGAGKDVTLALTPEAVIAGTVTLPTSEAPDTITLQLFRRQIQDGRAHWVPSGGAQTMSDGSFRFADLQAGTYKLLTTELLDTDPLTTDPRVDPFSPDAHGQLFGYPPVYYQSASDFETASPIQLGAGQTQTVNLALVKQPYYRVKVPVFASENNEATGLGVTVYAGHKGPGFALGYNHAHHAVEGMLPNGTYTVEVTSFRTNGSTGIQTIAVKGAPVEGPSIALTPNGVIGVNVKEEFSSTDHGSSAADSSGPAGRSAPLSGPRRYLNVTLDPADDFGMGRSVSLRSPTGNQDDALVIEGAPAGRYWVRVQSSRGYAASVRSGVLDLLHQPLVVGVGGAASPIEITMRDDMAEISGTVEGMTPPPPGPGGARSSAAQSRAHVYCIPLADSPGQFTEIWVHPDGTFDYQGLPPGAYRVVAFDRAQGEIEYRNPEAMQGYESKGTVVRLTGGQKESTTVQLISPSTASNE